MGLPSIIVMTPAYKAWLKRPQRKHLDELARQHGYVVKTFHWPGFNDRLVTISKDGIPIRKGRSDIFAFEDAIGLIRKASKKDA
jgi:hypothetical protein